MTASTETSPGVELREQARRLAVDVGRRLTDPDTVAAAVQRARAVSALPHTIRWRAHEVAQGDAGLAVLFGALDRCAPGEGWDVAAHERLHDAVRAAEATHIPLGMYAGWAGIGQAACVLSQHGARYPRLLSAIDAAVAQRLGAAIHRLERARTLPIHEYDLISGLAGVGAYLLARRRQSECRAVLDALAGILCRDPAGWCIGPEAMTDFDRARHPGGAVNCGLAHGIPGPLALIALADLHGMSTPRLRAAISIAAEWVAAQAIDDEWGPNWPAWIPLDATTSGEPHLRPRTAWCYGALGVARALWLAGQALERDDLTAVAARAIDGACRRPPPARAIVGPTFCHGEAGLLHVLTCFNAETSHPHWRLAAQDVARRIIDAYEPDSLVGFRCAEPWGARPEKPGLLDGAAGTALALASLSAGPDQPWNRVFLLA